jgi:hypothetical protein
MNIQFAVLWKGERLEDWQLRSVNSLLALPNVRASLLIRADAPSSHAEPLPGILGALPIVAVDEMPPPRARTSAAEAHEIRPEHDLDFILSFTDSPCSSDLLGAAHYGVWAFRFGDSAQDGAETAGFWEVYAGEPVTVARLVRLQPSPDAFVVLREGHLPTRALSVDANRRDVLDRITPWAALACSDIRNGVTRRLMAPPLIRTMPARKPPSAGRRLDCKRRIAARTVKTLLRSLFRHDHWNVGYVDRPISWFLDHAPAQIAWLPPPTRNEFFADPFGTWRDGRLTILFERFDYRTNLGSISAIEHSGAAPAVPVQIGPQPAVHLSYPYLIDAGDRLLCIPETHQAAEIGLYEAGRFPDRWVKIADLVRGLPIVDATLFRHGELWWLAGSEATAKGSTCELHLWHAEQITGPWRAHAANPVKVDVRSARPAGTPFLKDGALYRPAQDCSRSYGGRVVITRVVTLTPTDFEEMPAAVVEPDPAGPYPAGLHTLSAAGGGTLIDSKRLVFSPAEFRRVLLHYLRSAARRIRA